MNTAGLRLSPTAEVTYTEDGFESQMQVNHLGPFLLAGLLLTRLRRAAGGARFVTVSSAVHRDAPPRELEAELERWRRGGVKQGAGSKGSETAMVGAAEAYAKSKLAAVVFTREMQRRLLASGVLAASGGSNGSSGYGDVTTAVWEGDGIANGKVRGKMASAKGLISLASVPLLPPGGRGGYYDASGRLSISAISAAAEDEALANVLWKASEKAVGALRQQTWFLGHVQIFPNDLSSSPPPPTTPTHASRCCRHFLACSRLPFFATAGGREHQPRPESGCATN